jgi:hypothetical protein
VGQRATAEPGTGVELIRSRGRVQLVEVSLVEGDTVSPRAATLLAELSRSIAVEALLDPGQGRRGQGGYAAWLAGLLPALTSVSLVDIAPLAAAAPRAGDWLMVTGFS